MRAHATSCLPHDTTPLVLDGSQANDSDQPPQSDLFRRKVCWPRGVSHAGKMLLWLLSLAFNGSHFVTLCKQIVQQWSNDGWIDEVIYLNVDAGLTLFSRIYQRETFH